MQITLGDFNFIYQFGPIPSNLNKMIPTSFFVSCLVQKLEHLSPLRALFAQQQSCSVGIHDKLGQIFPYFLEKMYAVGLLSGVN